MTSQPLWQQKLLHGGRNGLRGFQRELAAKYAAMLLDGQPITGADRNVAISIGNCCGNPNRRQQARRKAPWKSI